MKEKICHTQPIHVNKNSSFVVCLDSLNDPDDLKADENGVWNRKGSPVTYISVHSKGNKCVTCRRSKMGQSSHHYKVTRMYYKHSDSPDFSRIIVTVHSES